MPLFQQEVIETRTYRVIYTVQAKNAGVAADKIAIGDTVSEEEVRCEGVSSREPYDDMVRV